MKKNVLKEDINPIIVKEINPKIKKTPTPEEVARRVSMHTMKGVCRTPFSTKCASNDRLFHIRPKERTEEQERNYLRGKKYRDRQKVMRIQAEKDSIKIYKIIEKNKAKCKSKILMEETKSRMIKREEETSAINKMINITKRTRCADNPKKFRKELNAIKALKQAKFTRDSSDND